jgi:hypothetical protein
MSTTKQEYSLPPAASDPTVVDSVVIATFELSHRVVFVQAWDKPTQRSRALVALGTPREPGKVQEEVQEVKELTKPAAGAEGGSGKARVRLLVRFAEGGGLMLSLQSPSAAFGWFQKRAVYCRI